MKKVNIKIICSLVVFVAFLCLLPSVGLALDCNATVMEGWPPVPGPPFPSIQAAINSLGNNALYRTINVTGTCNENIGINVDKNGITLDGGGTATINCFVDPISQPNQSCATLGTIRIFGKQATIKRFTITGGTDGIQVVQGGTATIRENNISGSGRSGIVLSGGSYGVIVNNDIHDIGLTSIFPVKSGIIVGDNSTAYIGYTGPNDTVPSPNFIYNNPYGIMVNNSSEGRIIGNKIHNNTIDGINVLRVSIGIIAGNDIYSNGQNGIFVSQNSGVNLAMNTGNADLDVPNYSTLPNGDKGLKCSIGGYADGILGTLAGAGRRDATDFTRDCINNLIP